MGCHTCRLRLLSTYCMPALCQDLPSRQLSPLPHGRSHHPSLTDEELKTQRRYLIPCYSACLPCPHLQISVTVVLLTKLCCHHFGGGEDSPVGKLF